MPFDFGDVVLVSFPFTSQIATKKRPAVVVSNSRYNRQKSDVVIMAITSQLRTSVSFGEVWLSEWQSANLLKPSAVKPVFATIEQTLIQRHLGKLSSQDQGALRTAIASVLGI
jgi:mRNA interferase MazF